MKIADVWLFPGCEC